MGSNNVKNVIFGATMALLAGCSGGDEADGEVKVDEHPAQSTFSETLKPKKIQSKPCSDYNLKFYEGDERKFSDTTIRLGRSRSDAKVEINGRPVVILGFEGQAEEYINYSIYRGMDYKETQDGSGARLMTKTETQVIVCFRKDVIAVKQLIENVRARGELSKASYLTKQWLWEVEPLG